MKVVVIKRVITIETVVDRTSYPDSMDDDDIRKHEIPTDKAELFDRMLEREFPYIDLDNADITTQVTFEEAV